MLSIADIRPCNLPILHFRSAPMRMNIVTQFLALYIHAHT